MHHAVTPFRSDGTLDEAAFVCLIERQLESGIDGLVFFGTTGEEKRALSADCSTPVLGLNLS